MAKIPLNNMSKELKNKLESAAKSVESKSFLTKLYNQIIEEIYKRTKLGYGVNARGDSQTKLKPLSESYKKQRKGMKLASDTSPSKSNLTKTGDMLNDLKCMDTPTGVSIHFKSTFSQQKVEWNRLKGRTFFNVSKTQITNITAQIKAKLKEILNSL